MLQKTKLTLQQSEPTHQKHMRKSCHFHCSIFFFSLNTCSITLTPEEGNSSVELVTNGRNIQVNEVNVYDYVRLYANYRLIKTHEKSLEVSTIDVSYLAIRYHIHCVSNNYFKSHDKWRSFSNYAGYTIWCIRRVAKRCIGLFDGRRFTIAFEWGW